MKRIKITGYELLAMDEDGKYWNQVAIVDTKELAQEWIAKDPVFHNWPHKYRRYSRTFKVCETLRDIKYGRND